METFKLLRYSDHVLLICIFSRVSEDISKYQTVLKLDFIMDSNNSHSILSTANYLRYANHMNFKV